MSRYVATLGPGRTATLWLANALGANVVTPDVRVEHEPFRIPSIARWSTADMTPAKRAQSGWNRWMKRKHAVYVAIGAESRNILGLQEKFQPKWFMLWRDPCELLASTVGWLKTTRKNLRSHDPLMMASANAYGKFVALEGTLSHLEALGIEPEHWHMDEYTTQTGLERLAESMGLELNNKLVMKQKGHPTAKEFKQNPDKWPQSLKDDIDDIINTMPRVRQAYEVAMERAGIIVDA